MSGTFVRALYRGRGWLWLAPAVPAALLTGLIMTVLPPDETLDNLADFIFRLAPLVLAVLAIAVLPRGRYAPALFMLGVIVYMGYFDTEGVLRIYAFANAAAADPNASFAPVYQFELLLASFVTLFALLAFRLGGARSALVIKVGIAAVLVVISGLNDLTFWATYTFQHGRPDVLAWASHMIVFYGHPPTVAEAVVFMAVHLVLAAVVLALPVQRWVDKRVTAPDG